MQNVDFCFSSLACQPLKWFESTLDHFCLLRQRASTDGWLAPWAGKVNQILHCDRLPERARWSYLARLGLPSASHKKSFPKSHIINPLLTYWPRTFFASLWTSTPSRSINMHTKKKNSANIQPFWPHTWSITHIYVNSSIMDCCWCGWIWR